MRVAMDDSIRRWTAKRKTSLVVERFNGRPRDECLNARLFSGLRHTRPVRAARRDDYNPHRAHTGLDGLTPRAFLNLSVGGQTLNRTNL
jgi:putative transposase